ncbi:MAG: hypothetical protein R3F59_18395 [Myxococcota bacterium]
MSDTAEFALAVAAGGGLPFLALSLVRGEALVQLLEQTRAALGDRPWGVGMLGFAPKALREEQLTAVRRARPGGAARRRAPGPGPRARRRRHPDLPARAVAGPARPLPARRRAALRLRGPRVRRARGPRTSFVLWEQCVERLLQHDAPHEALGGVRGRPTTPARPPWWPASPPRSRCAAPASGC